MATIKVISLQRSAARRAAFSEIHQHLGFEFIDATDGSHLPSAALNNRNLFAPGLSYTNGAYGAAISHLNLWNEAIRHRQALTICEDDAILRLDFEERQGKILEDMPDDWDLVFWGWNFDAMLSLHVMPRVSPAVVFFNQNRLRNSIATFRAGNGRPNLIRLHKCFGLLCYTISPQGAEKFKSLCFPLKNNAISFPFPGPKRQLPNTGLDIAMNEFYSSTNSYVCFPPIAVTKNEHEHSTIQAPQ